MDISLPELFVAPTMSSAPFDDAEPTDTLAYCCLVSPGVLALGLEELMAGINQTQQIAQISGLLMRDGRLMIHWLEAPRTLLDSLWARIQNDPRQHCLVVLKHEQGIQKRWFERWQMQPASRNEMMAIVREARELAHRTTDAGDETLQHAMSTLSILLNPELTPFYAQRDAQPEVPLNTAPNVQSDVWPQHSPSLAQAKRA